MLNLLIEPLLAGLSVGVFCITTCLPFVAPCLVAEERSFKNNLTLIGQFLLGRLIGYLAFGLFFGYLGEKLDNTWLHLIANLALLVLSALLILFVAGFLKPSAPLPCSVRRHPFQRPVLMGVLMGVNLCPPFLMSLAYVFSLHSAWMGALYFFIFFLASSVYFLPLATAGLLAKIKELRLAAHISGLCVGLIFFVYGLFMSIHYLNTLMR